MVFVFSLILVATLLSVRPGACSFDQIAKLAKEGNAVAQWQLAVLYAEGPEGQRDYKKALHWYRKAADQGLAGAQRGLGRMYAQGKGVKPNLNEAVKWFRKAADQGNTDAQCDLGFTYATTKMGDKVDPKEAGNWYRKAAEAGAACGQRNLGQMYHMGTLGVERDLVKAVEWYRKGAEQGDADSQFFLGQMYMDEFLGIKEDHAEASKWLRRAAKQGHVFAKFQLEQLEKRSKRPVKPPAEQKEKPSSKLKDVDSRENRLESFRKAYPGYGDEEFKLADEDLFPDWKKKVSPDGTWADFLPVYGEFVQWWIKAGSPAENGLKLWHDFLAAKTEKRSSVDQNEKDRAAECYNVAFDVTDRSVSVKITHNNQAVATRTIDRNRHELEARIRAFLAPFRNVESIKESLKNFDPEAAKVLYKDLLSDVLEKVPRGAHLTINQHYQHATVAGLPFEALVAEGEPKWQESAGGWPRVTGLTYLGDLYQISYARPERLPQNPNRCEKGKDPAERVLVIADPVVSTEDPRLLAEHRQRRKEFIDKLNVERLMGMQGCRESHSLDFH